MIRQQKFAEEMETRAQIRATGPWQGFTPDIDVDLLDASAARDILGLIARPDVGGQGEILTQDYGTLRVSGTSAALSDLTADWTATPAVANVAGMTNVVALMEMRRTDTNGVATAAGYGLRQFAITAGDGSTEHSSVLFWLNNDATQVWNHLEASADAASVEPFGDRDAIPDWAIMPSGAPLRTDTSGSFANVTEPCLVWCNGIDQVRILPDADGSTIPEHEQLTDEAALDPFIARSVENFKGRLFYFNTSESGVEFAQRLRWTAPFTADPSPTNAGSGVRDFRQFQRRGLRAETLGDVLACYFEDGVAFVSLSGVATDPVRATTLTQKRGLLGTHAMCSIDPNVHFGIFADGWWLLDSSGRWTEVGVMDVGGTIQRKWRDTFYTRLDAQNVQRLFCYFEPRRSLVYIVVPVTDTQNPTQIWIWDPATDRVWLDSQPVDPLVFGSYTVQLQAAVTWAAATGTWESPGSNVAGSWASTGSLFGLETMVHGNGIGRVLLHTPDINTRDGSSTTYFYETILGPLGSPRKLKTTERVTLEAINANTPMPSVRVFGDSTAGSQTGTANINRRNTDDLEVDSVYSRFTSEQIGINISGTHPLKLRSFEADLIVDDSERRNG